MLNEFFSQPHLTISTGIIRSQSMESGQHGCGNESRRWLKRLAAGKSGPALTARLREHNLPGQRRIVVTASQISLPSWPHDLQMTLNPDANPLIRTVFKQYQPTNATFFISPAGNSGIDGNWVAVVPSELCRTLMFVEINWRVKPAPTKLLFQVCTSRHSSRRDDSHSTSCTQDVCGISGSAGCSWSR
jgi:hypothetical protein